MRTMIISVGVGIITLIGVLIVGMVKSIHAFSNCYLPDELERDYL